MPSVPDIITLCPLFTDEATAVRLMLELGCISTQTTCHVCGSNVSLRLDQQTWRCTRRTCRKQKSIRRGSFFTNSNLSVSKTLLIGYAWLLKMPNTSIIPFTKCSSRTVSEYTGFFRQLVADTLDFEDFIIGGNGITVEIDECKLGKRKHNRGHHVEGVWVLGGVERTERRGVFLVAVPDRSTETLMNVIVRHVRPGSIILTDLWRGYSALAPTLMYEHRTVNHSETFVNPEDGTCTNTIEGTWNGIRLSMAPRKRTRGTIDDCLWEFIWRRKHASDLWQGFLSALASIDYPD